MTRKSTMRALSAAAFLFPATLALAATGAAAQTMQHKSGTGHDAMPMHDTNMNMDMSAMMRPDAAPPVGVVGGMNPPAGTLMPSLTYMHMRMDGNRDGTDDVSTAGVLAQFPVAPLSMEMDMLMAGVMYGVTDDIAVMAMVPYIRKSMDHVTRMGVGFSTRAEGFGDVRIIASYDILKNADRTLELSAGISLPTGSTDERDDTPAGANQVLPYPMQLGSGTFDLLPGFTYTGRAGDWSYGAQAQAVIRLGENDEDYAVGNAYSATAWGARRLNEWVSVSGRLAVERQEDYRGADPRLNPNIVPTADPDRRAGTFVNAGLGLNLVVPKGAMRGLRVGVEATVPLLQDLDGPQLERDFTAALRVSKMF